MKSVSTDASAVVLVEQIVFDAIAQGASDVHIESLAEGLRVRYRVDGVLFESLSVDVARAKQVLMRIKVLAKLDVAQQRMPQDGMFCVQTESGSVDIRVATFPGVFGEKIVLRILDRSRSFVSFDALGIPQEQYEQLSSLVRQHSGLILVTGPTGSGKTTTLYALLEFLRSHHVEKNHDEKNIVTLEDPVECVLDGITQAAIKPEIGFSFERGIRALVRQDPDIIMVGEIRDADTACAAVRAALTGHVVVSSLHTPDAPRAIIRLLDMGVEPYLLAASLKVVVSQRLVRLLCPVCKKKRALFPNEKKESACYKKNCAHVYSAGGCDACFGRGFCGRVGVFETLFFSDTLEALVRSGASLADVYTQARSDGWLPLAYDAFEKVRAGLVDFSQLYSL